ncbi:MAG: PLP-dependent transferase [Candidatus Hydrogenedentes bacterium]|nr:PLP-dependent transferase [Candidatus Hydrogenedentota bacterium]
MLSPVTPRNLITHPRCRPEDLGKPLPDSPHATSVALPCWDHVVGYEEGRPKIVAAMELGYPRFVIHPRVTALFSWFEAHYGAAGERCLAFPSAGVAKRCAAFLEGKGWATRQHDPREGVEIHGVFFPEEALADAKAFWQHFGKIVSSRRAEAFLENAGAPEGGATAKQRIRARIAGLTGEPEKNVWLFPSGMAALSRALRLAQARTPGAKSIQLGFPYVDVLKIQTIAGPGAHFVADYDLEAVEALLKQEPISAVVCEFPGNPLLRGCSLPALGDLAHAHGVPLIVDDTPATYFNVQTFPHADMVVTSLTKAFSGVGDVMAGALVLHQGSPFQEEAERFMAENDEDLLWDGDALVLEANSRDFETRMAQVNATGEALCDWLRGHPAVADLYYPKYTMKTAYDEVMRAGGGYGGLFSLVLHDAPRNAPRFYDALEVSKGPSLGNNFTLACPYTLLAHYGELDWAEEHGVFRYLVRVSVGLEPLGDLKARFARALDGLGR